MQRGTLSKVSISDQVKEQANKEVPAQTLKYDGDDSVMISTGSTLLDLAISGGRVRGGGVPGGILVEIFGPSSCGKTVMLCELAGSIQRQGGQVMFRDPEARLNKQFARIFDFEVDNVDYDIVDTVPQMFEPVRTWHPEPKGKIHAMFGDSLAALSTELELEDGDKMGMRRAKEFSEQMRKVCRTITHENYLVACSNQIRQKFEAQKFEYKYVTPGGEALPFYASLRLRGFGHTKMKDKKSIRGKDLEYVVGVKTMFEVYKSSVWKPYRVAPVYIVFNYGIDDIRANLEFVKKWSGATTYVVRGEKLKQSMVDSIAMVEEHDLEAELREETIDLWEELETHFVQPRKPKVRI